MRIEDLSYINFIKNYVIKKESLDSLVEKLVFHFFICISMYHDYSIIKGVEVMKNE